MNKEIKKEWVAALRSGDYKQGVGELCKLNPDGSKSYCCLGVLTDILIKKGHGSWVNGQDKETLNILYASDGEFEDNSVLIAAHYKLAELKDGCPYVTYNKVFTALAALNDQEMLSFNEIADLIEEQL